MSHTYPGSDSSAHTRPFERQPDARVARVDLNRRTTPLSERPDEARVHTDVHEATARAQDSGDLAKRPLPVLDIGMDERGHRCIDAVRTKEQAGGIAHRNRQSVSGMPQLAQRSVDAEDVPSELAEAARVPSGATTKIQTDP